MTLGVNEFVSEALKNGYKIEDVVGFMGEHESPEYKDWANKWNTKGFGAESKDDEFQAKAGALESGYQQQKQQATTTNVMGFELPSVFTGTGSLLTAGAALGAAALAGGKAVVSGIKNRSIKNPQVAEVVGELAKAEVAPTDYTVPAYQRKAAIIDTAGAPVAQPTQMTPEQVLKQRSEQIRAAGIQPPAAPQASAAAPQTTAAAIPPAQQGPATVTEAVATGQASTAVQKDVAGMLDEANGKAHLNKINPAVLESADYKTMVANLGDPTHVTGSGMPAWGGQGPMTAEELKAANKRMPKGGVFEDLAKVPKGSAVVPGAQYYDALSNAAHGIEQAQSIVREKGAYPASYEQAKQWAADYLKSTGAAPRSEGAKPPNVKGIMQTVRSSGGKGVKIAGVAGAFLTLADLANAAQQAKEGNYAEAAKTAVPALDPTGLAFAAVNPKDTSSMLTGASPMIGMLSKSLMAGYEKNLKEGYEKRVGAGRGMAPPSAYQR